MFYLEHRRSFYHLPLLPIGSGTGVKGGRSSTSCSGSIQYSFRLGRHSRCLGLRNVCHHGLFHHVRVHGRSLVSIIAFTFIAGIHCCRAMCVIFHQRRVFAMSSSTGQTVQTFSLCQLSYMSSFYIARWRYTGSIRCIWACHSTQCRKVR